MFFISLSIFASSASASRRLIRPSSWIRITSSRVEMSDSFVYFSVSISAIPRSDSLAASIVPVLRMSAFLRSSSFGHVGDLSLCGYCLFGVGYTSASTIWLFQRGIVLMRVDWIFSTIIALLFCTRRICGAIWMEIIRVSSRS